MKQADAVLEVRNLRTTVRSDKYTAHLVDGVNLSAERGRTLGIVGESGCGKSVTALSIMGLVDKPVSIDPSSQILLNGENLVGKSDKALRKVRGKDIAMIFQEPMSSLNPVETIGFQIDEALRMHENLTRADRKQRSIDLLSSVGIADPESRLAAYAHQMSGGMQQRVMIAMALACNPQVLIADEPTTALDVTIQAQILDLLSDLIRRTQTALVLITHDLGVVAKVCDDVAVMYSGRVVERGSVNDIFSAPRHPYTQALLASIPRIGADRSKPLNVIPGLVQDPFDRGAGCRFADRCALVFDRCRENEPELLPVSQGHSAACWLAHKTASTKEGAA